MQTSTYDAANWLILREFDSASLDPVRIDFGYTKPPSRPNEANMRRRFTLEYWQDGKWYVGRLIEVPGVFSQGKSLDELRDNIQDAYDVMVTQDRPPALAAARRQRLELEV